LKNNLNNLRENLKNFKMDQGGLAIKKIHDIFSNFVEMEDKLKMEKKEFE
jgi:hypothetical protein